MPTPPDGADRVIAHDQAPQVFRFPGLVFRAAAEQLARPGASPTPIRLTSSLLIVSLVSVLSVAVGIGVLLAPESLLAVRRRAGSQRRRSPEWSG
jgi:hypothetical protein